MKRAIVTTTVMAALTASFAVHADEKKADEKFCAAVTSYRSDVAELKAMGPHSTVAELKAAKIRIDKDVSQMQTAASKMKTPTAKTFLAATKKLDQEINNIPDEATLKQVRDKLQADVQSAESAGRDLAAEAGCPAAPPEGEPTPPPEH
jgi:hypothetical protein